jgi:hypothetical protein
MHLIIVICFYYPLDQDHGQCSQETPNRGVERMSSFSCLKVIFSCSVSDTASSDTITTLVNLHSCIDRERAYSSCDSCTLLHKDNQNPSLSVALKIKYAARLIR